MKTRTYVSILILVFAVLITVGSCATSRKTMVESESILSILTGTWVNHEYDDVDFSAKTVAFDGSYDLFAEVDDTRRTYWGQYTISEAWIDSTGTYWYKATFDESWTEVVYYELGKIDSTKSVWEWIYYSAGFPDEWEPENSRYIYRIFYRQE